MIIALWKAVPSLIMFYTDTVSVRVWRRGSEGDRDPHPSTFDRAPSPQQGDAVVPAPVARHAFRRSPAGVHVRLKLQNIAFSIPVFHQQQWSSHLCLRTPLRRSSILSPSASRLPDPVCSLLVSTATRGGGVPLASQCNLRSCRPSSTGRAERFNRRTRSGLGSAVLAPASRASSEGTASNRRRQPCRWTRRYPHRRGGCASWPATTRWPSRSREGGRETPLAGPRQHTPERDRGRSTLAARPTA